MVFRRQRTIRWRVLAVSSLALASAACASGGVERPRGGFGGGQGAAPAINDPAPIVSGTMRPYQVRGRWYRPEEQPNYNEVGQASWYGDAFNGRPTATGEIFDMHALTAAHKTLPLPGLIEVTNLANGRRVVLRVNDRGPFVDGRIVDLSRGAAQELGLLQAGVGQVRVRYLGRAPRLGGGRPMQMAEARSAPPPVTAPLPQPSRFWVQAGAFSDGDRARRAAETLGQTARVDAGAGGLFRVMMGPWPDANTAERARQAAVAYGYADAQLISGG
ncbi:MAG TPA: septal ring lytic transglycosylase RlpA family protein [Brevundimonas sp.]|uniref:septal ring lytic transglycosylase RlpA family protein n=1 Tax=Brevundimonas sp. TaxID=1871086 RepID=UPI0026315F39|nr:septal ring lytic transglycosylase RlpA family protein [Brevundimonas sp.]HRO33225.1 septal ring lytic transglycosylase RlpA family protein [Brevundimonas sp.]